MTKEDEDCDGDVVSDSLNDDETGVVGCGCWLLISDDSSDVSLVDESATSAFEAVIVIVVVVVVR